MSLTVPTYIRTSDTDKYLEVVSKGRGSWTEFIHNALNPVVASKKEMLEDNDVSAQDVKFVKEEWAKPLKTHKVIKTKHVNFLKKK